MKNLNTLKKDDDDWCTNILPPGDGCEYIQCFAAELVKIFEKEINDGYIDGWSDHKMRRINMLFE